MERDEEASEQVRSGGEVLGPAVAQSLDVAVDGLVGPAANAVLIVATRDVRVLHRHPGGRLGVEIWSAGRSEVGVEALVAERVLVLSGPDGRVAFRPADAADVGQLTRELSGGAPGRGAS